MRRLLSRDNTPPPTTFDHFFSLCSVRQTPPQTCGLRRISVFVRVVSAMRAPHHTPIRIKALDVSPPGQTSALGIVHAPENRRFPAASTRVSLTHDWRLFSGPVSIWLTAEASPDTTSTWVGQLSWVEARMNHRHGGAPLLLPVSHPNPRGAHPQPHALSTSKGTRSRMT